MKVIAIIPARGGSKRLPRKNIFPIWGKPLIYWSIKAAKESKYITDVWVSTEDDEIARIAIKNGAKVHRRDAKLSKDHVYKMEAIRDTISYLEDNELEANVYISLQANSPEITSGILDDSIEVFLENDRNELISVGPDLMQNAAFRILKRGYAHHKDLSTKCGVYMCNIHDVHTLEDVKFIEERNADFTR